MKKLFEKTRIGPLELPNRFVRSATWMGMADPDGSCNNAVLNCYDVLAGGGIGLIITGFAFVSREGQGPEGQLGIYDGFLVDGLRRLVLKVHEKGAKIAVQIVHCGAHSKPENNTGLEVIGPSDRSAKKDSPAARAMTIQEITRVVDDFGAAAERAKDAGFDAIQLHFAHGYLGSQFLSPHYNMREDRYGGSFENRCRFPLEVYEKVRQAVGDSYPVMAKMNIEDFLDDGLIREHGIRGASLLSDAGLDAIEVSGGTADSGKLGPARKIKEEREEAYFLESAAAVKKAARMPVMLVGGLRTPSKMARIQNETGIDCFSMSRPLIREPHLINRWNSGDFTKAECVSCSGCFLSVKQGKGIFCLKTRK